MVVCGTRKSAQLYATALAEELSQGSDACRAAAELIDARLGVGHTAAEVLRKGVATHYSALPRDVLAAIEDLGRAGQLRFMVATTALTEGVNLPVRTVVVAESGGFTKEGFKQYITGARLLNALGRAGRAAKETEGWLVLGLNAKYDEEIFGNLRAGPDQNEVRSELLLEGALKELAEAEGRVRASDDALFEDLGEAPRAFVAFVWGTLESLGQFEGSWADEERLLSVVQATLAWQQGSPEARTSLETLARATGRTYQRRSPEQRRRWAQSGMGIASARRLEEVVDDLYAAWQSTEDDNATLDERVWLSLHACGVFSRALELDEAPPANIFNQATGKGRYALDYSIDELVRAWVSGNPHKDIGDTLFVNVVKPNYRLEQTVDLVSRVVSSYLSWIVGTLLTWLGAKLAEGDGPPLDSDVPYPQHGPHSSAGRRRWAESRA